MEKNVDNLSDREILEMLYRSHFEKGGKVYEMAKDVRALVRSMNTVQVRQNVHANRINKIIVAGKTVGDLEKVATM